MIDLDLVADVTPVGPPASDVEFATGYGAVLLPVLENGTLPPDGAGIEVVLKAGNGVYVVFRDVELAELLTAEVP